MPTNSKCATCARLEVWPSFGFGGPRYLCEAVLSYKKTKAFGRFGRTCSKGVPQVKECEQYRAGMHYSRKASDASQAI